jgi:hypothetical protein
VVEDDNGGMEEEVVDADDDRTLEADSLDEEEPAATSTPRRGHLSRPLVRSGSEFLIRIWEKNLTIFNPVLSCVSAVKLRSVFSIKLRSFFIITLSIL